MRPHIEIRGLPPGPVRRPGVPAARALTDGANGRPRPAAPGHAPPTPAAPRPEALRSPLDLNRATTADLERLSGIGPALAARIVEDRTRRGTFATLEDLLRVRGIGPATLERLRPLVRVGGP
jgi:competence protein ComEA